MCKIDQSMLWSLCSTGSYNKTENPYSDYCYFIPCLALQTFRLSFFFSFLNLLFILPVSPLRHQNTNISRTGITFVALYQNVRFEVMTAVPMSTFLWRLIMPRKRVLPIHAGEAKSHILNLCGEQRLPSIYVSTALQPTTTAISVSKYFLSGY